METIHRRSATSASSTRHEPSTRASRHDTTVDVNADINRDSLWRILAEYEMRPIAQITVDETWSALRFRMLREGEVFNTDADG